MHKVHGYDFRGRPVQSEAKKDDRLSTLSAVRNVSQNRTSYVVFIFITSLLELSKPLSQELIEEICSMVSIDNFKSGSISYNYSP